MIYDWIIQGGLAENTPAKRLPQEQEEEEEEEEDEEEKEEEVDKS